MMPSACERKRAQRRDLARRRATATSRCQQKRYSRAAIFLIHPIRYARRVPRRRVMKYAQRSTAQPRQQALLMLPALMLRVDARMRRQRASPARAVAEDVTAHISVVDLIAPAEREPTRRRLLRRGVRERPEGSAASG